MTDAATLIVIAQSARALALSARRAGYAPVTIDLFGDADTRALSLRSITLEGGLSKGIGRAPLIDSVRSLARRYDAIGVVYGSGFEHQPELIAELAQEVRVYGADACTLARAKDPRALAHVCADLNLRHPEISLVRPPNFDGWLTKSRGAAGGGHVRLAVPETGMTDGDYFQRRIEGRSVSALFVSDGRAASILGLSEQWTAPSSRSPFRYGGAVGPIEIDGTYRAEIENAVAGVARAVGVVGIASVDFVVSHDSAWLIEVNPRPGATLDLFDCDEDPLLARHLEASGGWISPPATRITPTAVQVVYAGRDIICRSPSEWPDWVVDRPCAGTRIPAGEPICTALATAPDTARASHLVARRTQEIKAMVEGWTT